MHYPFFYTAIFLFMECFKLLYASSLIAIFSFFLTVFGSKVDLWNYKEEGKIIFNMWRTTFVGFCSFMTPLLLPSNPTNTKTMRVSWALLLPPTCYLRASDWLFMTRSSEGFLLRSKVYVYIDPKPFTGCLCTSLDPVINLYIFTYHPI